jgi:protein SCO1/2
MNHKGAVVLSAAGLLFLVACGEKSETRRFDLTGRVVSVDAEERRLVVNHDEVPGFMQAMTMPFSVHDNAALETVSPGDEIQAVLVVTGDRSWLEQMVVTGKGAPLDEPPPIPNEPSPGDPVPDLTLVNQNGQPIHLGQYRGKTLLVTFIYTRCPLPEFCPRMTSHFEKLEEALRKDSTLYNRTHLLMVSFDHEYDSPEVLRDYATSRIPGLAGSFDHFELATGSQEEIVAVTSFFGLTYWPEENQIVHSLRTAIIGPDGNLEKLYRGNEWEPEDIMEDLKQMGPN